MELIASAQTHGIVGIEVTTPSGGYDSWLEAKLEEIYETDRVRISLDCGHSLEILSHTRFPREDVPCTCGNPEHWFVKYRKVSL